MIEANNRNNHDRDNHDITLDPQDNKFFRVREKIRNPALGNDAAWEVAQPFFGTIVPGYPEACYLYSKVIRTVFDARRNAFLDKITTEEASRKVQEVVTALPEEQQDRFTDLVVVARDLFYKPVPFKKKLRR